MAIGVIICNIRVNLLLVLLVVLSESTIGQVLLKGQIMDSKSDVPLDGATIFNQSRNLYKKAAYDGQFSIAAQEKDTIVFSSIGYISDTIAVSSELLKNGLYLGLKSVPGALDTVTVAVRTYAQDSAARREDYRHIYERRPKPLAGGERPSEGFGVKISPFTYFSKEEKAKRKFRKQLEHNERQAFIDFHFRASYVHRVTGLEGDSLNLFMRRYRPSYSFMRKANDDDLLRHINDSYKQFTKPR